MKLFFSIKEYIFFSKADLLTDIHSWLIGKSGAAEAAHDQAAAGQAHLSNSEQFDFSVKQFIDCITQESKWNVCLNSDGVKTL